MFISTFSCVGKERSPLYRGSGRYIEVVAVIDRFSGIKGPKKSGRWPR